MAALWRDDHVLTGTDRREVIWIVLEDKPDRTFEHHETPPHVLGHLVGSEEAGGNRFVVEHVGRSDKFEAFRQIRPSGHSSGRR